MENEQAMNIVDDLNTMFNTRCRLSIKPYLEYGREAYYNTWAETICIKEKSLEEWVLIHEFAHHIAHQIKRTKNQLSVSKKQVKYYKDVIKAMNFGHSENMQMRSINNIRKRRTTKRKNQKHHDRLFIKALKHVAIRYYGSIDGYKPTNEYKCVQKALGIKI